MPRRTDETDVIVVVVRFRKQNRSFLFCFSADPSRFFLPSQSEIAPRHTRARSVFTPVSPMSPAAVGPSSRGDPAAARRPTAWRTLAAVVCITAAVTAGALYPLARRLAARDAAAHCDDPAAAAAPTTTSGRFADDSSLRFVAAVRMTTTLRQYGNNAYTFTRCLVFVGAISTFYSGESMSLERYACRCRALDPWRAYFSYSSRGARRTRRGWGTSWPPRYKFRSWSCSHLRGSVKMGRLEF